MSQTLDLSLRIKTDLQQGRQAMQQLGGDIEAVGNTAAEASAKLNTVGESAEQQASRIENMVRVSLEQRDALTAVGDANQRAGTSARESATDWQALAAAQTAAMRGAESHAQAGHLAAEAAQAGAAAVDKEAAELSALLGQIDPVVAALDRLDDMEQKLRVSRQSGHIDVETYNVYNAKLAEQRTRVTAASAAMRSGAVSAGQYKQAMRQLPAQITDITTSLVSGMPVWMVAVQQGGQIKDSFGGWGAAARAVLSSINPMTVAVGGAAGVVVGFAAALESASRDNARFNESLIQTNNYAGQTSASVEDLARAVGSRDLGRAREILTGLAGTGRLNVDTFDSVGKAAIAMAQLTGQSADQIVGQFSRMEGDAAKWAREMNQQYHVLDTATTSQIESLQEQGRTTEAVQLISEAFFDAATERSKLLDGNLTTLQSTWNGLGETVSGWTQSLKDLATETAASFTAMGTSIKELSTGDLEALLRLRSEQAVSTTNPERFNAQLDEIAAIKAELAARKELAAEQARELAQASAADDALADISKRRLENLSKEERKQRDLNALVEDYITAWNGGKNAAEARLQGVSFEGGLPSGGQFEIDRQRIEERYAEKVPKKPKVSAEEKAFAREQKRIADQAKADAEALQNVHIKLLAGQGQYAAAAAAQIEKDYGDLITRMEARGDVAGVALVNRLISVEKAKAQLGQLQGEIDRVFAEQSRQETTIQAKQQAGLISETGARQQIINLQGQTAAVVEKLIPQMEKLAAVTGDPASIERLADLKSQLESIQITANETTEALRAGFEDGLSDALVGLTTGTKNLEEAAVSFVQSITTSMAQLSSQKLAQSAFDGIAGTFDSMISTAPAAIASVQGVQAAKVAADQAMTASTLASTATTTATTTAAAAETATAWSPAAIAASIGSFGGAAAIGLAAVVAALAFKAFADGGHVRGPGTGTSDSIPSLLSNNEFVTRAAVVTQPGALPFLDDFNRRGMVALDDWGNRVRHATGGLAGVPAPAMPAPGRGAAQMAEPAAAGPSVNNRMRVYILQNEDELAQRLAQHPATEKAVVRYAGQNGNAIRAEW